jgi:hypothetical protein
LKDDICEGNKAILCSKTMHGRGGKKWSKFPLNMTMGFYMKWKCHNFPRFIMLSISIEEL